MLGTLAQPTWSAPCKGRQDELFQQDHGEAGAEDKMGDSAQMNMWLHKTVLQKIADNGGNVPKELLD